MMMFPPITSLAGIAVLAFAGVPGPAHTWIADIKAQRATLAGLEVRLEGEVVDVRSTSPTARRGFYRLTDASDPIGVLIRTETVPIEGGLFRVRAKMAADQVVSGTLLLDELERDQTNARPVLPGLVAVASGLALVLLVVLYRRAHTEERRFAAAPPLWLLPDSGPYGKTMAGAPPQPPLKYDPELEEADRYQRDRLKRRKRSLVGAMAASLALTGTSAAWVLTTKPVASQVPAFIFIDSTDPSIPVQAASPDTTSAEPGAPVGGDSAIQVATSRPDTGKDRRSSTALALTPRPAPPPAPPPETPRGRRPDSSAGRSDTVVPSVTVPAPAPSPTPAPLPPPPPPPAAPTRDPEVDRTRAQTELNEAAGRLVAAINAKRAAEVALLVPESMAGDLGRRERFLKLVRDFGPKASLGGVDEATVTDDRGEARISIAFAWRGDFGVDKKKTGRLLAVVRREGDAWRFDGARLLDAVP